MNKLIAASILIFLTFFSNANHVSAQSTDCTSKFPINKNGATGNLLYCSNKDLNTVDNTVKRLIIVIHGTNRTASNYFASMSTAAKDANSTDSLIIAPHFVIPGDVSDTDVLTWAQNEGWKSGDPSQSPAQVSSYEAIDDLITSIVGSKKFPSLKQVVVAGHSAGGQFTDRYAAGTQIDAKVKEAGMSMRYVVANPSSYLYFTPERPVNGSTTQFAAPSDGSCSGYDTYKYGFTNMNAYMSAVGADKIKSQFKDKNVIYLLGDQDTDPQDSDLDKSCEGEAQGSFRFQRGNAYYGYIAHLYGDSVHTNQILAVVPGVAHDDNAMFDSDNGKKYLFQDVSSPASGSSSSSSSTSSSSSSPSSSSSDASSSNASSSNPVPSAVCAGSTNNVCPSPAPSSSSSSSSQSSTSSLNGSAFNNTGNLGNSNILMILITFLLKLFSGF